MVDHPIEANLQEVLDKESDHSIPPNNCREVPAHGGEQYSIHRDDCCGELGQYESARGRGEIA